MKNIVWVMLALLAGCAQLLKGQEQPVVMRSAKDKIFYTTCSGAVEHWGNCYEKASRTCPNGYKTLEKTDNANGGFRTITFRCL